MVSKTEFSTTAADNDCGNADDHSGGGADGGFGSGGGGAIVDDDKTSFSFANVCVLYFGLGVLDLFSEV